MNVIQLPISELRGATAKQAPINGSEVAAELGAPKANILLVDDRPDKLLALEAVLSSLGENLVKAKSGKEALRQVLQYDFAVILLDVSMPVMDGFETAAMIRSRPSSEHTPIIFVTSINDSDKHVSKGYSLGAVDYILSPIVPAVLKAKVSVFVDLFKKTEKIKAQAEQLRRMEEAEHTRRLSEAVDRLEAETQRNRFFNLSIDLLAIASFEGYMLQLNPTWQKTLGYTDEELKASPGLDFVHPEDRTRMYQEMDRLREQDSTGYFEGRYRRKDGTYRWLGWTAASFARERLLYIFARDITDKRQAEHKIQELNLELQERVLQLTATNADLEAFNYSISHDLRAPLRSMSGFANALLMDSANQFSAESREYAQRIVKSAAYMDRLLMDLLQYSRVGRMTLELVPIKLELMLTEVLAHIGQDIRAKGAHVDVRAPLLPVVAHGTMLDLVLSNLIQNAIKFAAPERTPTVAISTRENDGMVRVIVEDNGIGIALEYHEKIFGLFERLHDSAAYPGTGVGLAIVRKSAERMGGKVGLESKMGEGSKFWVELPMAKN
jgi:PAS domain S-box-containing protein